MPNRDQLFTLETYLPYLLDAIRIVFIFILAYVFTIIAERSIRALRKYSVRMMLKSGGGATEMDLEKRAATISGVARKAVVLLIWTLAILMALQKLGFEIGPLIASLGVAGVAVGLGAQNLIKDMLAGMFLLLENQIRVNDVAVINGTGGLVEEINLRTTVLRGDSGAVHVFANGSIQTLSNLTRDYSYFVFEVVVDYKESTDRVVAEIQQIVETLAAEEDYKTMVLAPLEVWGVDKLAESGVVIKGRLKTPPGKQWPVGRELNRRIKMRFTDAGINIAFPARTLHFPDLRDDLKRLLAEVIEEARQPDTPKNIKPVS